MLTLCAFTVCTTQIHHFFLFTNSTFQCELGQTLGFNWLFCCLLVLRIHWFTTNAVCIWHCFPFSVAFFSLYVCRCVSEHDTDYDFIQFYRKTQKRAEQIGEKKWAFHVLMFIECKKPLMSFITYIPMHAFYTTIAFHFDSFQNSVNQLQ